MMENAKRVLVHYIQRAWEVAGLRWETDNAVEVEGIIDDILAEMEALKIGNTNPILPTKSGCIQQSFIGSTVPKDWVPGRGKKIF